MRNSLEPGRYIYIFKPIKELGVYINKPTKEPGRYIFKPIKELGVYKQTN